MSDTPPDITSEMLSLAMDGQPRPTARGSAPPAPETARLPRRQVVSHLLLEIREKLDRAPDDRVTRTLQRKLESLQFVVGNWNAMPPSPTQVSAMLEVLVALQEAAAR